VAKELARIVAKELARIVAKELARLRQLAIECAETARDMAFFAVAAVAEVSKSERPGSGTRSRLRNSCSSGSGWPPYPSLNGS
jgi:hypothetical protein